MIMHHSYYTHSFTNCRSIIPNTRSDMKTPQFRFSKAMVPLPRSRSPKQSRDVCFVSKGSLNWKGELNFWRSVTFGLQLLYNIWFFGIIWNYIGFWLYGIVWDYDYSNFPTAQSEVSEVSCLTNMLGSKFWIQRVIASPALASLVCTPSSSRAGCYKDQNMQLQRQLKILQYNLIHLLCNLIALIYASYQTYVPIHLQWCVWCLYIYIYNNWLYLSLRTYGRVRRPLPTTPPQIIALDNAGSNACVLKKCHHAPRMIDIW